jgi:hypothetical protein
MPGNDAAYAYVRDGVEFDGGPLVAMTSRRKIARDHCGRMVAERAGWLGTPYRHQGFRKGVGCDCLGLVRGVWRAVYGSDAGDPGTVFGRLGGNCCGRPADGGGATSLRGTELA